jgi:hypothetical protein
MKPKPQPSIETVPAVTMEHGKKFAYAWFQGNILDALDETGILTWPLDGPDDAQARCLDIADEITRMVFDDVRREIAEAFVRVANAVIYRERKFAATRAYVSAKRGDE